MWHIKIQDAQILSTVPGCIDRLIREAVELELRTNNRNRWIAWHCAGHGNLSFTSLERADGPLSSGD